MSGLVRYVFPFGGGVFGQLDLPSEMSRQHADRLKAFVETLCLEPEPERPPSEDPVLADKTRAVMEEIRRCTPGARLAEVPTLFAFGPIYYALLAEQNAAAVSRSDDQQRLFQLEAALLECQRNRVGDTEQAGRLLGIIAKLKHGTCWCGMGLGHPSVSRHSDICKAAAEAVGAQL